MSIIGNIERSFEFVQMMLGGAIFRKQASDPLAGLPYSEPHLYASSADAKLHYVDENGVDSPVTTSSSGGGSWQPVRLASVANLAGTYVTATQTLTVTAVGALSVDGVAVAVDDRILLKDQGTGLERGIYVVTVKGAAGVHPVLVRASDANDSAQFIDGKTVAPGEGTLAGTVWVFTTNAPFILDTGTPAFARETNVMHTNDAQTITAVKTFGDGLLKQLNAAGTFAHSFTSLASGADVATIPAGNFTMAKAATATGGTAPGVTDTGHAHGGVTGAGSTATMAVESFTAPATAGVAVHAQIDDATASPIIAGLTSPAIPRALDYTFGAAWGGGNPTITGTDQDDQACTETPVVALGTTVKGVVIFKTVTSIAYVAAAGGAGHFCAGGQGFVRRGQGGGAGCYLPARRLERL